MEQPYFSHGDWSFRPDRDIYLICVIRDEAIMLNYFVDYYNKAGVTHFIFVDNGSEDKPAEVLTTFRDVNIKIYHQSASYKDANYGVDWVNQILKEKLNDCYCVVVDADEILLCGDEVYNSIRNRVDYMRQFGLNMQATLLLDMYPRFLNDNYRPDTDFNSHSQFYDIYNEEYYHSFSPVLRSFTHKAGGMRKRLFGVTVCIHKLPLFRYNFKYQLAPGYHFLLGDDGNIINLTGTNLNECSRLAFLLHYKYVKPHSFSHFLRRIDRNQDWDNSVEYKRYCAVIDGDHNFSFFDKHFSQKYENYESLSKSFSSYLLS